LKVLEAASNFDPRLPAAALRSVKKNLKEC